MDYSCRDIPMRLDIRHQPLNFDIYLSQDIDLPRTSLDEPPYNFQLEVEALERVDMMLVRTRQEHESNEGPHILKEQIPSTSNDDSSNLSNIQQIPHQDPPPPSCPTEALLTPIKSTYALISPAEKPATNGSTLNRINPQDFEDMHYNPFDHLELQTIDELRELDLVFQASYANNHASNDQVQPPTNDSSTGQSGPGMITKQ